MFDLPNHRHSYSTKDFAKARRSTYFDFYKSRIKALSNAISEYNKRKEIKALLKATNERLADLGIERSQLITALKLPLNQSAGLWLSGQTRKNVLLK